MKKVPLYKLFLLLGVICFVSACKETVDVSEVSYPPYGTWVAAYSDDFAEKYNLPKDKVSNELSPDVAYMELDIQPHAELDSQVCFVNMLINRPNDFSYAVGNWQRREKAENWYAQMNERRELLHMIPYQRAPLRLISSVEAITMDYYPNKRGGRLTVTAFYSPDIFEGYDYLSYSYFCGIYTRAMAHGIDNFGFRILKSSIWGKNKNQHTRYEDVQTPKGEDFEKSFVKNPIPKSLTHEFWKY